MIINPYRYGSGGAPTDPYWANVVSLLNMGGADGSTAFPDSKGLRTWSTHNTVTVKTTLGYNAALFAFDGALRAPSSADFALGTGDFTIETWARVASISSDRTLFNVGEVGGFSCGLTAGKPFAGSNSVSYGVTSPTALSINTLYAIEYSRSGGTGRLFVDGVQVATGADTYNYVQGIGTVGAGSSNGGASFAGYIGPDSYVKAHRLTKGIARHTTSTSFTPPPAPFPTS